MISSLNFSQCEPRTPKLAIHVKDKGNNGHGHGAQASEQEVAMATDTAPVHWAVPRSHLDLHNEVKCPHPCVVVSSRLSLSTLVSVVLLMNAVSVPHAPTPLPALFLVQCPGSCLQRSSMPHGWALLPLTHPCTCAARCTCAWTGCAPHHFFFLSLSHSPFLTFATLLDGSSARHEL